MRAHFSSNMPEPIVIETSMSGGSYYLSLSDADDLHCELHEAMREAEQAARTSEVKHREILSDMARPCQYLWPSQTAAIRWALDNLPEPQ